jgi:hypothetical protein
VIRVPATFALVFLSFCIKESGPFDRAAYQRGNSRAGKGRIEEEPGHKFMPTRMQGIFTLF